MKDTKKNLRNIAATGVSHMLKKELESSANSTACTFLFQPKEPKGLEAFRRK